MSLASLGWATWWLTAFLLRFAPALAPELPVTIAISCGFASAGLLFAIYSLRARLSWLLFTLIPILANGSVLMTPFVIKTIRVIRAAETQPIDEPPRGSSSRAQAGN